MPLPGLLGWLPGNTEVVSWEVKVTPGSGRVQGVSLWGGWVVDELFWKGLGQNTNEHPPPAPHPHPSTQVVCGQWLFPALVWGHWSP